MRTQGRPFPEQVLFLRNFPLQLPTCGLKLLVILKCSGKGQVVKNLKLRCVLNACYLCSVSFAFFAQQRQSALHNVCID